MVLTGEICFGLEVFLREENETGSVVRPVVSQVGPGDLGGMIQMASCQGQGFLVTLVTAFTGAAALGEEGMPVLGEEL